ncbi:MAG TPA: hypothetical protein VF861_07960 [Telluria sp.]
MKDMNVDHGRATAERALAIWNRITRKFGPLLGPGSAELLFTRSLDDNRGSFPWLPVPDPGGDTSYEGLEACLAQRTPDEIVASTRALLASYVELLTTLIGARLTNQFLRSAFPADEVERNKEEKAE